MIGATSSWRWSLVNQQGYRDAFQIEWEQRRPDNSVVSATTLQYLALAGRLEVRSVVAIDGRGAGRITSRTH